MDEWRRGWRVLLGCALGGGTGSGLLFLTFSIFNLPLIEGLGSTPAELAQVQTLIILAAIGSPLAGFAVDRYGFRVIFMSAMAGVVAIELSIALFVETISGLAVGIMLLGLFGVATTGVTTTRPVSAWFEKNRGLALGLAACGTAVATVIMPPVLEACIANFGWRAGFASLAMVAALVGLPAVFLLVRNEPEVRQPRFRVAHPRDLSFLQSSGFWTLVLAITGVSLAQAGFVGQMSPMLQAEGLSASAASVGISAFAVGTLIGRLAGGWALDRFDPRRVAVILGVAPASGFLLLWGSDASFLVATGAALLIGFQQGAEIDIFAYFTARTFGVHQYGAIYGSLIGISWAGTAAGLIGVGVLREISGNYDTAQVIGALAFIVSAAVMGLRRDSRHGITSSMVGATS